MVLHSAHLGMVRSIFVKHCITEEGKFPPDNSQLMEEGGDDCIDDDHDHMDII